jgi:hypothetical protein
MRNKGLTEVALGLIIGWFWILSALDHWTTWACLHQAIPGWDVVEAHPIGSMLFEKVGLEMGLLIDSIFTVALGVFLYTTNLIPAWYKIGFLAFICILTYVAVYSNVQGMKAMGIL